jgi:ribonuclease VapC
VIVVDASVLVAILAEESDSEAWAARLDAAPGGPESRFASTVTLWEASCALARIWRVDRMAGFDAVTAFSNAAGIVPIAPDMTITELAVAAAERYGNGVGYPGILNLGDCFSYATAKHLKAALLFKGDDFSRTDIEAA